MTSVLALEWHPPNGGPVVTLIGGSKALVRLLRAQGLEAVAGEPVTTKAPGQAGETALDVMVPPRVVTAQAYLQSNDPWAQRDELGGSFSIEPLRPGEEFVLGRLRAIRHAPLPAVEVQAMVRSVAFTRVGVLHALDVEWYAPTPWWTAPEDTFLRFEEEGGFVWPLVFPLAMPSFNIEQVVVNPGNVSSPVLVRLYGEVTTPCIHNETTGEALELVGDITADQYLEVNTSFGRKSVELVTISTGARVNALDRLNLNLADFWQLRPGANELRFEADVNVSGRVDLYYRPRWGGI